MKKLILLFAMLMLLCGGTAGLLKWLELGPFVSKVKVVKKVKKVLKDTAVFVDMEPLGIPIFQGNKVAATVQIQIKLEANGESNAEFIKKKMPVLTDAFVRDLHSFLPRLLKAKERVDVLILKQRLQYISDKVAGKGMIENVLVQSVIDQPR